MTKKTTTKQILIALHKVVGYDMSTFSFNLSTGRLINDARISEAANTRTSADLMRDLVNYGRCDHEFIECESVDMLTEKGYITKTAITRAKRIKYLADRKTRIMG